MRYHGLAARPDALQVTCHGQVGPDRAVDRRERRGAGTGVAECFCSPHTKRGKEDDETGSLERFDVEFFNLVTGVHLTSEEKEALVAFLDCL